MKQRITHRILVLLIRDRTRITSIMTALIMALAGMVATRAFGFELTAEHNAMIVGIVTLVLSYAFEIITTEVNARGIERIQEASGVEVDRYVGPVTVAAVTRATDPGDEKPKGQERAEGAP